MPGKVLRDFRKSASPSDRARSVPEIFDAHGIAFVNVRLGPRNRRPNLFFNRLSRIMRRNTALLAASTEIGLYSLLYICYNCPDHAYNSRVIRVDIDRILRRRKRSLYWLAKESGITYVALHNLRSGKSQGIKYRVLEAICQVLECGPGEILTRVESPECVESHNDDITEGSQERES